MDFPCTNRYGEPRADDTLYEEENHTYCFDQVDLNFIDLSQLNPYTGRQISQKALADLGSSPVLPDPASLCDTEATDYQEGEWIAEALTPNFRRRQQRLNVPRIRNIAPLRPCEAGVIYRGLTFEENDILFRQLTPVHVGELLEIYLDEVTSWSHNIHVATMYGGRSRGRISSMRYGIVFQTTATSTNTYIDLDIPRGRTLLAEAAPRAPLKELRLLPGLYEMEVVGLYRDGVAISEIKV